MAYTIPLGNAVNYDFLVGDEGYAAPAGNLLSFNFTEVARNDRIWFDQKWSTSGIATDTETLDQKWATNGSTPEEHFLTGQWQVISYGTDPVLLDQKFSVLGVVPDAVRLTQAWSVLGITSDAIRFTQQWAVDYSPGDQQNFGQQWSVIGQESEACRLDGQWQVAGVGTDTERLNSLWSVLGVASDTIRLSAEWVVLGATPDTWRANQEWIVNGIGADAIRLNQLWDVEGVPSERLTLNQQWLVAAGSDSIILNQAWSVTGLSAELSRLTQTWQIEGTPSDQVTLTQQWAVATPVKERNWLNQQWAVEEATHDLHMLDTLWAVNAPANERVLFDFIWSTIGARLADRHYLTQQWALPTAPIAELAKLTQQWTVHEVPTDKVILDQQFDVEGVSNDLLRFIQLWTTFTYDSDTSRLNQSWYFRYSVREAITLAYGAKIAAAFELLYDLGTPRVRNDFVLDSSLTAHVRQAFTLPSNMGRVQQQFDLTSAMYENVRAEFNLPSPLFQKVRRAFTLQSVIKDTDTVRSAYKILYALLNDAVVVNSDRPVLTIRGQEIELTNAEISIDEGQFAWTCQCTLANPAYYQLFNANDPFTVTLAGEEYSFIVDSKQRSRDDIVSLSAVISGISPTAIYADPRATAITKTWDSPVAATEVVAEVLGAVAVDWRVLDWVIPAFRLAVSNDTPISVVMKLAAAIGGYIETNPDGSLYVRYAYPVAVPDYVNATPDQVYSDDTHKFLESENLASNKISDKLRILDVATDSFADRIEFTADKLDPNKGVLKVWPSPWRDSFSVDHTSLPIVSLSLVGLVTEDFEETIEILRGEGRVSKPIYQVLSVDWLYADLGGVVFEVDNSKLTSTDATKKESLLKINYRTRYYEYNVVAFPNAQVQFLVLEPQDG